MQEHVLVIPEDKTTVYAKYGAEAGGMPHPLILHDGLRTSSMRKYYTFPSFTLITLHCHSIRPSFQQSNLYLVRL